MQPRDAFYFFWSGPFSQWARYEMSVYSERYVTCEQYMMRQKALLFGDEEIAAKIMRREHPAEQKRLGQKVRGFDGGVWDANKQEIVYQGNLAKFSQHADLGALLRATADRLIVEASPVDAVWGIGLAEEHPDAPDPAKWPGQNLLGRAIMRVRETLTAVG